MLESTPDIYTSEGLKNDAVATNPSLPNSNESRPHLVTEESRREQLEDCKRIAETVFYKVGIKIGDTFHVTVSEDYYPNVDSGVLYKLNIFAQSAKVERMRMNYYPIERKLDWYNVVVFEGDRGKGIGTELEEAAELIARMLKAHSLKVSNILDSSLGYWQNKPGMVFDKTGKNASKQLL